MDDDDTGDVFVRASGILPEAVASTVGYASTQPSPQIHRGLPSPYLTFIITLDEPVIAGDSPEQAMGSDASRLDIVAAGLHTSPAFISQQSGQSGIQLAVHPTAARRIFGVPAAELVGGSHDGVDVMGPGMRGLRDRLIGAPTWRVRFAQLDSFLSRRPDENQIGDPRPEAVEAYNWLSHHDGAASIQALADHVFLSQRHLRTVFEREYGIGPKTFNRLLRFQRTIRTITQAVDDGRPFTVAGLAYTCGYADQSHLDRDFRAFTGTTTSGWLHEELANIRAGGHRNGQE